METEKSHGVELEPEYGIFKTSRHWQNNVMKIMFKPWGL